MANDGLGVAGVGFAARGAVCRALDCWGEGYVSDIGFCMESCQT